ncbi:MAG: nuclear transport factor 2 family protein [Alteromonadaceae bacterium]|nr:nuclear transport factor 2 family protein [Alteromonadaceae bacterium]
MTKQIKPPFTLETAKLKVQRAEDLWNDKNPEKVALAYTEDSQWRNRGEFVKGRENIAQLLTRKWERELDYKLKKELFTFSDNRIAVHFQYEYHDDSGQWFRAYGNEHWQFDEEGLMHTRDASINEIAIDESERKVSLYQSH